MIESTRQGGRTWSRRRWRVPAQEQNQGGQNPHDQEPAPWQVEGDTGKKAGGDIQPNVDTWTLGHEASLGQGHCGVMPPSDVWPLLYLPC